jgi:hypothetical protein
MSDSEENNNSEPEIEIEIDTENEIDNSDIQNIEHKTHTFQLKSFYDQYMKTDKINLSPEYQRDFAWNTQKQELLIDSIMNNYIIPLYIIYKTNNDKKYKYECVDGQHRMRVIKHYMSGIPLDENHIVWKKRNIDNQLESIFYEENDNTRNIRKKHKRYMTMEEKELFNDRLMSICEITSKVSPKVLYKIFYRLQQGQQMSNIDKLKTIDHNIIIAMRQYKLFTHETYNLLNLDKIFNLGIKNKQKSAMKRLYVIIFIRSIILLGHNNKLDGASFMDMNMIKYIEDNLPIVSKGFESNDKIVSDISEIINLIKLIIKVNLDIKLCKYTFYILLHLYIKSKKNEEYICKILKFIKKNNIYNNYELFEGEKLNKIPASDKIIDIANKLDKLEIDKVKKN